MLEACQAPCAVLVVARDTEGDRVFVQAIEEGLDAAGARIAGRVFGQPRDVRLELERISGTGGSFDAIATHRIASEWGPVRTAGTPVFAPGSYYWPTFLTARNLLNVVNQNADIAIIALGMTLVILTAGIDLSVGSLLALAPA